MFYISVYPPFFWEIRNETRYVIWIGLVLNKYSIKSLYEQEKKTHRPWPPFPAVNLAGEPIWGRSRSIRTHYKRISMSILLFYKSYFKCSTSFLFYQGYFTFTNIQNIQWNAAFIFHKISFFQLKSSYILIGSLILTKMNSVIIYGIGSTRTEGLTLC